MLVFLLILIEGIFASLFHFLINPLNHIFSFTCQIFTSTRPKYNLLHTFYYLLNSLKTIAFSSAPPNMYSSVTSGETNPSLLNSTHFPFLRFPLQNKSKSSQRCIIVFIIVLDTIYLYACISAQFQLLLHKILRLFYPPPTLPSINPDIISYLLWLGTFPIVNPSDEPSSFNPFPFFL